MAPVGPVPVPPSGVAGGTVGVGTVGVVSVGTVTVERSGSSFSPQAASASAKHAADTTARRRAGSRRCAAAAHQLSTYRTSVRSRGGPIRRASSRLPSNRNTNGTIEITIVIGSVPGSSIARTAITRIA